jgi:hypothetical protein
MVSRGTPVVKKGRSPMAAKKTRSSKKVTITIDVETLQKLRDAVDAISEFAGAFELGIDDAAPRRGPLKRGPKKRR